MPVDEFVVESPSDGAAPQMDPRRALLLPLWRGRYLILCATLLGILGGVLYGVMRPNIYRSYGKLMIRAGQREELTPEMSVTGSAGGGGGGRSIVLDEIHLVSSPEVFEAAARSITPAVVFQPYDPGALDDESTPGYLALFHRWQSSWFQSSASSDSSSVKHPIDGCDQCVQAAALVLAKNTVILAEPGSDVITISYPTHDPLLAQQVVAAFLEAAIAHHRKIYETGKTLEFLDQHLLSSLSDVTLAENDLTNFKTECGVFDFANQQATLNTSIDALDALTKQDDARLESLRRSTEELAPVVASLPPTIEERTAQNLQPNPDRAVLKTFILQQEAELAILEGTVVGLVHDRDLQREKINQLIKQKREELEKLPEFTDTGPLVRTLTNPRRDRLQQQLDDARHDLNTLEAAATVRRGQLAELHTRRNTMAQCKPTYDSKETTASLARDTYDRFRAARAKANIMGSMDELDISNLRTIQQASLPNEKEGPLRGKLLLIGLLLGAVAGGALSFARNMFDHKLHDALEVEQLLGTAVLGSIPQLRSGRDRPRATRRAAL